MDEALYRVAIVGPGGQHELLDALHNTEGETNVRQHKLDDYKVLYKIITLPISRPDIQTPDRLVKSLGYRRDRMDAIVFTFGEEDPRGMFVEEVSRIKMAEVDLHKVIVFGDPPRARTLALDYKLGHYVSQVDTLRGTLLAVLMDTTPRDVIILTSQSEVSTKKGC